MLGCTCAHLGDTTEALVQMEKLDRMEALYPETHAWPFQGLAPYLQARIASVLGNQGLALSYIKSSYKKGRLYTDWYYHFDQDFINLKGYQPFEEFITPKDRLLD